MAEHPYAAIVREGIDALNRQDHDGFGDMMADDIVWHMIGVPEPVRGKAAMTEGLGGGSSDFTITAELHDVTASDDHVVALVRAHATRGDEALDYDTAEIFHVKNGKVVERWAFSDDTARIVDFFG
ncbi:MAG: nuclear transport factor 2 family protein [Chloroflexota bacterium]|nr:nuclear transport factor 2 family protein [Chloroflexota bacterium]